MGHEEPPVVQGVWVLALSLLAMRGSGATKIISVSAKGRGTGLKVAQAEAQESHEAGAMGDVSQPNPHPYSIPPAPPGQQHPLHMCKGAWLKGGSYPLETLGGHRPLLPKKAPTLYPQRPTPLVFPGWALH